jgi:hypothetical protein
MELQISTYAQYWNPTGGAEHVDASGGVFDDGEDVLALPGQGDGLDEVAGEQGICLGPQEICPGGGPSVGSRVDALGPEDLPDG